VGDPHFEEFISSGEKAQKKKLGKANTSRPRGGKKRVALIKKTQLLHLVSEGTTDQEIESCIKPDLAKRTVVKMECKKRRRERGGKDARDASNNLFILWKRNKKKKKKISCGNRNGEKGNRGMSSKKGRETSSGEAGQTPTFLGVADLKPYGATRKILTDRDVRGQRCWRYSSNYGNNSRDGEDPNCHNEKERGREGEGEF